MSAPFVIGQGADTAGLTGATTYPFPSGYTATQGDTGLLIVETNLTGGVTAPTGWPHITNSPRAQGSNVTSLSIMRCDFLGGESAPQIAGVSDHQVGFMLVLGNAGALDFAPVGSGNASGSNMSATGGTTLGEDRLVLVCSANQTDIATDNYSAITNSTLTGFTVQNQAFTANGNGGGVMVATGTRATAGATGTTTATIGTAGATANLVFAIMPNTFEQWGTEM